MPLELGIESSNCIVARGNGKPLEHLKQDSDVII